MFKTGLGSKFKKNIKKSCERMRNSAKNGEIENKEVTELILKYSNDPAFETLMAYIGVLNIICSNEKIKFEVFKMIIDEYAKGKSQEEREQKVEEILMCTYAMEKAFTEIE